jgi:DNA-binding transcriptional MerR regulator
LSADRTHHTAAQAARTLGVSIKSLRVWERLGLLEPDRSAAGWRQYGPNEFARIHQVLALKSLGLSLAEIAEILDGRRADLDAVLALQVQVLVARKRDAERGLALISTVRDRLRGGESLPAAEFANLIRQTAVSEKPTPAEVAEILRPYVERHFTPEEQCAMRARWQATAAALGEVPDTWDAMFVEARALMAAGDPSTAEAANFPRRWSVVAARFHLGDPVIAAKMKSVWEDALSLPGRSPPLPTTREMVALVVAATEPRGARAHKSRPHGSQGKDTGSSEGSGVERTDLSF